MRGAGGECSAGFLLLLRSHRFCSYTHHWLPRDAASRSKKTKAQKDEHISIEEDRFNEPYLTAH